MEMSWRIRVWPARMSISLYKDSMPEETARVFGDHLRSNMKELLDDKYPPQVKA